MSKYAIIQLQGKQFKVAEKERIIVDRLDAAVGDSINVADVLLCVNDDEVTIGHPELKAVKVTLKVLANEKGEKIDVFKYKSKSRYRKTRGHRQLQTTLEVVSIKA